MTRFRVRMAYDRVGAVRHLAQAHAAEWLAESYGVDVEVTIRMRTDAEAVVRSALADLRVEVVSQPEDDL